MQLTEGRPTSTGQTEESKAALPTAGNSTSSKKSKPKLNLPDKDNSPGHKSKQFSPNEKNKFDFNKFID